MRRIGATPKEFLGHVLIALETREITSESR
jgi:hypothetical protein